MIDLANPISGLFDQPLGSNRVCSNLSQSSLSGTPCCRAIETASAKLSIRPLTVEPSLAMVMNSSPGSPSGYRPTVMYPSWPPTLNLCVMEARSSCSLWRTARGGAFRFSSSCWDAATPVRDPSSFLDSAIAVDGHRFQAQLPGLQVGLHNLFDRGAVGQVDRFRDRA